MSAAHPAVSVVVAAYDAEATLGEQLAALAAQQGAVPFEVLVCDNGSSDGTRALALSWQDRIPGLQLVDASARRGPAAARNVGARRARADLLAFCDSDDVVAPGWLSAMHAALADEELVAGQVEIAMLDPANPATELLPPSVYRLPVWPAMPSCGAGYLGVRTAVFRELGGFEESLPTAEDIDFVWRAQLAGHRLAWCADAVVHVRLRTGLRAAFRQSYGYGRGARQLAFRYRRVIAAAGGPHPDEARARTPWTLRAVAGRVRHVAAQVYRLRHPGYAAELAQLFGRWCGRRFARVDRTVPQLDPAVVVAAPRRTG